MHKLGTREGALMNLYSRSHFDTWKQNFITINDVEEEKEISLRHCAALSSVDSGEGYNKGHCLKFVLVQEEENPL